MEVASFVVQCAVFIMGFALLYYYPSYFKEKGKNLATKQDIGAITQQVELIKNQFIVENEILKSRLSLSNQNRFSINDAERNALISLNRSYTAWLYSILDFNFNHYNRNNFIQLLDDTKDFNSKKLSFHTAQGELDLFIWDPRLTAIVSDIAIATNDLQTMVITHAIKISSELEFHDFMMNRATSEEEKQDAIRKHGEEVIPLLIAFGDERSNAFAKVLQIRNALLETLKGKMEAIFDAEKKENETIKAGG